MAQDFTVDRNSSKWVLGDNGYLKEYTTDQPAIEFNADGSYKGVLVEPQSTNLCLRSENLGATWIGNNSTATQSTEITPDGDSTNKYIKLVDDNGGGTGQVNIYQIINVSANTQYTASVFLKADGLSFARLRPFEYDGGTDGSQFYELSGAGSLGTAVNLDNSSIQAYPNGWYRCSITWTQGASDTQFTFVIAAASSISNSTVPIDGTSSILVWGAQVEESPIATSYIPTTTGAVTRVKDDIYLTSASSLIGQTEGTMFIEVDWQDSGADQILFNISDNTSANVIRLIRVNSTNEIKVALQESGGPSEVFIGTSSSAFTGIYKFSFAYKTSDSKLFVNGAEEASSTATLSGFSSTISYIDFGQAQNATAQANMWIRAVALFTSRLTDTQCEDLTTI